MAEKLLTVTKLDKLRRECVKKTRHSDGGGLYAELRAGGVGSWIVRVQVNGKRRDIGLGSINTISLSQARQLRDEVRQQYASGIDPVSSRKNAASTIPTFKEAAERVHAERVRGMENAKHRNQWIQTLRTYAFPVLGKLPVNQITNHHIHDVLSPIWLDKNETAKRVKQRLCTVLDWCYSKGWREHETPIRAISKGLPKPTKKRAHHKAMPYPDLPDFFAKLREHEYSAALALQALILTAARSGEIRFATWDEIDFYNALWSIPAERMKAKRPHNVPLSPAALDIFSKAMRLRTNSSPYVFRGQKAGRPLSDNTLKAALRRMGEPYVPHGFRSSFKDWAGEVGCYANELSEAALAHVIKDKTEAAYRRGDLLARRREMMDSWANFVDSQQKSS